jgi:hypothetical protein
VAVLAAPSSSRKRISAPHRRGPLGRPGLLVPLRDLPAGDQDLAGPSKQAMLTELIRDKVTGVLPPTPATGALHTDLRELLAAYRGQLANPLLARIGAGLLAEASCDSALAEVIYTGVTAPRRAAARAIPQGD